MNVRESAVAIEFSEVLGVLDQVQAQRLTTAACTALEDTLPHDGWYWRSWFDASDRQEMWDFVARLKALLVL